MNQYPSEWDMLEDEEQPIVEADSAPPQPAPAPRSRRQAPPRSRQAPPSRESGNWQGKLALAVSILALIVSCIALFLVLRPEAEEPEEPPAPPPAEAAV